MVWREEFGESVLLLGDWLARWRRAVGVSQRTLAARAGIDQGGLSRVERGLQLVGGRRLARIIDTLDQLSEQRLMGPIAPPPFRRQGVQRARAHDAPNDDAASANG